MAKALTARAASILGVGAALVGVVAAAAAAQGEARAGVTAASAGESDARSELTARFGATTPGAPTGLSLRVLYKDPSDPAAKPPPLESARFELPAGTRIDGGALPACEATDEQLRARGREACPAESKVGDGTFVAVTGFGPPADPVTADVTLYNGGDEVIELVTFEDSEAVAGFDRLKIRGSALVVERAPATPGGPPEGRTVPREIAVSFPQTGGARPFLTTPESCPGSGAWVTRGVFTFTDGGASTVTSETPCSSTSRARRPRPSTRLRVSPRRVRAKRTVRFRFRARGTRRCIRGATVRIAGRRARTGRRGRASRRIRFRQRGWRVVRLTKRGCPTSRTRIRVLRQRRK